MMPLYLGLLDLIPDIPHIVVPEKEAPASLAELLEATRNGEPIPVSEAHSDDTIWGFPANNHAFRAWHDSLHIIHAAEFDEMGEYLVAREHLRSVRPHRLKQAIWGETFGQVVYHKTHGAYPRLQRAFVRDFVEERMEGGSGKVTIGRGLYH